MTRNYRTVQALRAVAAGLVVVHHTLSMWGDREGLPPLRWTNAAGGVDIFFVISGFVMAISTAQRRGGVESALGFLKRRVLRVVPLYWLALTWKLADAAMKPVWDVAFTPWRIVGSYLFVPVRDGRGGIFPIVTVGWTLNFEMLFYGLFALAFAMELAPLGFLIPCLTGIAALGVLRTPAWPAWTALVSPVVLEFLYGMVIARVAMRRGAPAGWKGAALLLGGFVALLAMPAGWLWWGFLAWGLPAAMIVAGAAGLEESVGGRVPRWLLACGDASYALYLSHLFILPFVLDGVRALGLRGAVGLAAALLGGIAASTFAAVLVHRWIERPMTAWLTRERVRTERVVEETLEPVA